MSALLQHAIIIITLANISFNNQSRWVSLGFIPHLYYHMAVSEAVYSKIILSIFYYYTHNSYLLLQHITMKMVCYNFYCSTIKFRWWLCVIKHSSYICFVKISMKPYFFKIKISSKSWYSLCGSTCRQFEIVLSYVWILVVFEVFRTDTTMFCWLKVFPCAPDKCYPKVVAGSVFFLIWNLVQTDAILFTCSFRRTGRTSSNTALFHSELKQVLFLLCTNYWIFLDAPKHQP